MAADMDGGRSHVDSFALQVEHVRQQQMEQRRQQEERSRTQKGRDQRDEVRVKRLLAQSRRRFVEVDSRLWSGEAPSGQTGFVIRYAKNSESVRPEFGVQVTCQEGNASIKVTDGHWEQLRGTLGAWADWTDEREVYNGFVDEGSMRQALQDAFIRWYEAALQAPDEPPQQDA